MDQQEQSIEQNCETLPALKCTLFDGTKIEIYPLKYLKGDFDSTVKMLIIPPQGQFSEITFESIFSALEKKKELYDRFNKERIDAEDQLMVDRINNRWQSSLANIMNPKTPAFVSPINAISSELTQYSM